MQKAKFLLLAPFGNLFLINKQKKPFVCRNNKISEPKQASGWSFQSNDVLIKSRLLPQSYRKFTLLKAVFQSDFLSKRRVCEGKLERYKRF